ncbi:SUN domain-containing protein 2 [Nibea albiflora]|uniref:SUN domain-containing protein 2 n=1 Tax=Nibea albiflora TaxID=240163 RepID=A0ACB7F404_NIBAL|nr:SUN domain-containing protein 2 [Nibea albiflora]
MLRRSLRLREGGYYNEEGTPSISYREMLNRVFQTRRRRDRALNREVSTELDHNQTRQTPCEEQTQTNTGEASFKMTALIMSGVLLLLLAFGETTAEAGTHLGRFIYERDGEAFQTFDLPNPDIEIFRYVRLEIENNWGNIDYTCIYSFRVHGNTPTY